MLTRETTVLQLHCPLLYIGISSYAQVITEKGATTANINTSQRRHVRFEEQQESASMYPMAVLQHT